MKWFPADCKPGDIIRVKAGSVYHYGIFVSEGEVIQFGLRPDVRQEAEKITVCSTDIDEFCNGDIVEVGSAERSDGPALKSAEVVAAARARLGETGYDFVNNNCEHFAFSCYLGQSRSLTEKAVKSRFGALPAYRVFLASVKKTQGEVYPPQRQREIQSCKNADVRAEKYSVWALLGVALKETYGADMSSLSFKKTLGGKWICKGYNFSLSHSHGIVCVALSGCPAGVDIEEREQFINRFDKAKLLSFRRQVIAPGEEPLARDAEGLLSLWTAKESLFKLSGKGAFRPCRISAEGASVYNVRVDGRDVRVGCAGEGSDKAEFFVASEGGICRAESSKVKI